MLAPRKRLGNFESLHSYSLQLIQRKVGFSPTPKSGVCLDQVHSEISKHRGVKVIEAALELQKDFYWE